MDALRNVHRALRTDGALLDLQPCPGDSLVEVLRAGVVVAAVVKDEAWCTGQILRARDAMDSLVAAGLFAQERSVTFTFVEYADSVEDWNLYRADQLLSPLDEMLAQSLRAKWRAGDRLRMIEEASARRFRRAEGRDD